MPDGSLVFSAIITVARVLLLVDLLFLTNLHVPWGLAPGVYARGWTDFDCLFPMFQMINPAFFFDGGESSLSFRGHPRDINLWVIYLSNYYWPGYVLMLVNQWRVFFLAVFFIYWPWCVFYLNQSYIFIFQFMASGPMTCLYFVTFENLDPNQSYVIQLSYWPIKTLIFLIKI